MKVDCNKTEQHTENMHNADNSGSEEEDDAIYD